MDDPPERSTLAWPGDTALCCETLESLTLVRGRQREGLREGLLGQILSTTKRLQHLAWMCLDNPIDHPERRFIYLDQFTADLCAVRASLKSLEVTAGSCITSWSGRHRQVQLRGSMARLKDLNNLTDLHIPVVFLGYLPHDKTAPLADFLPPSIVTLYLSADLFFDKRYSWTLENKLAVVREWFNARKATTPRLTSFTMGLSMDANDGTPSQCRKEWRHLRHMCWQEGISLILQRRGWNQGGGSDPIDRDDTESDD